MRVPNSDKAVADIRKLTEYLLDPEHVDGRHKARLFMSALGLGLEHAEELRRALLIAVTENDAVYGRFDRHGQRYTVDFLFDWRGKSAIIRSGWIVEHESDIPRLTTAYPL
jgi:hypothetical protein